LPGSANANEAVQILLVQPGASGLTILHEFPPQFTYPIFGEEERIFGYKGLEIDVKFGAHDLRPHLNVSYDKRFTTVGGTSAFDIHKAMKQFLPAEAFVREAEYQRAVTVDQTVQAFTPPGELISTYMREDRTFEIWAGSLLNPSVRKIVDRMQVFISFFIEAGTPINTKDFDWTLDRWRLYFVYEKVTPPTASSSPYSFVGYSTTYRFFTLKPSPTPLFSLDEERDPITPKSLPSRVRISQFLILPPHQQFGHGSAMYQAIYTEILADPTVFELSVEDPSEEFDKLRDVNDWKVLEPEFRKAEVKINIAIDTLRLKRMPTSKLLNMPAIKTIRANHKIASRQFARQLEMYLLSLIPFSHRAAGGANMTTLIIKKSRAADPSDKAYYWWRLILKQRIFKKNRTLLLQLDLEERIPKIDESARAQEDEYEILLLVYATAAARDAGLLNGGSVGSGSADRKRKVIDDDEDDEEDAGEPKRARSELL
jgi:histone acetyltransferase 1